MQSSNTPLCECHGEPMYRRSDKRKRNPGWRCSIKHQEYRERHKYNSKVSHLKRAYGLTPEDFEAMIQSQDGCAICHDDLKIFMETHVDHCHDSGKVRGLLCGNCNRGLGQFKDDPTRLRAAAAYLETHSADQ